MLKDGAEEFAVSLFQRGDASRTVLFAVGGGGNPFRHAPLLNMLAEQGCTVVAPHFERMAAGAVAAAELALRMRRVCLALDYASSAKQTVYAVGHSIGAAVLLGLAGARIRLCDGKELNHEARGEIERMVLLTPAMDFFTAPGALDGVRVPIQAWAGSLDTITPPAQTSLLKNALGPLVDARFVEGAGHFSFMNELPPHIADPMDERETFLGHLNVEVSKFLFGSRTAMPA